MSNSRERYLLITGIIPDHRPCNGEECASCEKYDEHMEGTIENIVNSWETPFCLKSESLDYNPKDKAKVLDHLLHFLEHGFPEALKSFENCEKTGIYVKRGEKVHPAESASEWMTGIEDSLGSIRATAEREHDERKKLEVKVSIIEGAQYIHRDKIDNALDKIESLSRRLTEQELNADNIAITLRGLFPGRKEV